MSEQRSEQRGAIGTAAGAALGTGGGSRTVEAVWRIESARLIAALARVTGDVGLAEDLAQDALVAALEQWPAQGVPDNPGAWLTAVARRRRIDTVRRAVAFELNRAVAVAMADGPAQALAIVDSLEGDPALRGYHLLPAVRGDLLARLGRTDQAERRIRARGRAHR